MIAHGQVQHRRITKRGIVVGPPMPHMRVGTNRSKWSPRAKAYYASQKNLSAHLLPHRRRPADRVKPVRFACAVYLPPTEDGLLTKSGNDWSNYIKALEDAAKHAGIIHDDSAFYVRGPADLPDGTPSGVYLADENNPPGLVWAVYEIEERP